jgi:hypothetical protein
MRFESIQSNSLRPTGYGPDGFGRTAGWFSKIGGREQKEHGDHGDDPAQPSQSASHAAARR